jgi:hypothetical protein
MIQKRIDYAKPHKPPPLLQVFAGKVNWHNICNNYSANKQGRKQGVVTSDAKQAFPHCRPAVDDSFAASPLHGKRIQAALDRSRGIDTR